MSNTSYQHFGSSIAERVLRQIYPQRLSWFRYDEQEETEESVEEKSPEESNESTAGFANDESTQWGQWDGLEAQDEAEREEQDDEHEWWLCDGCQKPVLPGKRIFQCKVRSHRPPVVGVRSCVSNVRIMYCVNLVIRTRLIVTHSSSLECLKVANPQRASSRC